MGTQSFGKGSVQTVFSLPGGAGLKLTTARYYTPKGRSIQAKGITPDIIVESGELPVAPKRKAMAIREQDLENHFSPEEAEPARTPAPAPAGRPEGKEARDNQLDRALDLLKGIQRLGSVR